MERRRDWEVAQYYSLPTARKYWLEGAAGFGVERLVHVWVQETLDVHGLVERLQAWRIENEIPVLRSGSRGIGYIELVLREEDAERVIAWLREQGAEPVKEKSRPVS